MNWAKLFEIVVSDVLIAILISGMFVWVSNKNDNKNEKELEKMLQQIKDHIDLKMEISEEKMEKQFIKYME